MQVPDKNTIKTKIEKNKKKLLTREHASLPHIHLPRVQDFQATNF